MIMLILITSIFKVLAIIWLIAMSVTKIILKILVVEILDHVLTMALQIRQIHQGSEESKSREVSYSSEDFVSLLRDIFRKNMNRIKIVQLDINSIRNKFDQVIPAVARNLNILLKNETI